jgi:hypothetical protein
MTLIIQTVSQAFFNFAGSEERSPTETGSSALLINTASDNNQDNIK